MTTKLALYDRGLVRVADFCAANNLDHPSIVRHDAEWGVGACAYYRPEPVGIQICLPLCAAPGYVGRQWSWPGYVVDRTPFGVLCHELGHYVDWCRGSDRGAYWSDYSAKLRASVAEDPITSYCPDDAEWFAEIFRLFATNPDLLSRIRPRAFAALRAELAVVELREWMDVLAEAPERTIKAALGKIEMAGRKRRQRVLEF